MKILRICLMAAGLLSCATEPASSEKEPPMLPEVSIPDRPFVPQTVLWGRILDSHAVEIEWISGGSDQPRMAAVDLIFIHLPEELEGKAFTLIGGGLQNRGFHGPSFSGFLGRGFHFARTASEPGPNPLRNEGYEADYTRVVTEGRLEFRIYYAPSSIHQWGERYVPGSELALTLMHQGTADRILHAGNNPFNWSLGGVGLGNKAKIVVDWVKENTE